MAGLPLAGVAGIFGRFLGNAISGAAGYALGEATADVLRPRLQPLKNQQNQDNAHVPPAAGAMAQGVAQGQVAETTAAFYAKQQGLGDDQFAALVAVANVGPPLGSALTLLRRGVWLPAQYRTALNREGIESEWYPGLATLKDEWLTPSQVALGIVRSLIPDPGLMPVTLDTSGRVPAYPQFTQNDALTEALGGGIDKERLQVLVGSIGLPMSVQQAANAMFRGIIDAGDFNRAILEGDTRPEWAPFILDQARQYPTAHDYVEDTLRGWSGKPELYAGTAKHGMSQADTNILFRISGRPLSWHQVFIGLARGGTYDGPTTGIAQPFLKALQESNIRPEWYNLAWAQRYTYPAAFVLRALTQGGDVTQAESEQILLWEGWEPTLAAKVAAKWAGGATTTATQKKQTLAHLTDEYLSGALTRAALTTALAALGYSPQQVTDEINLAEFNASKAARAKATTAIGKRFIALQLDTAGATQAMAALGWPQGAIDKYVAGWTQERDDEGTTLTKAQVVKAAKLGTLDQPSALARLEVLGVSAADAAILLADA